MEITSEEKYDIAISRAQYRYQKNILIKNASVGCKVLLKLRNLNPSLADGLTTGPGIETNFTCSILKGNLQENFIATKISNGYGCLNVK